MRPEEEINNFKRLFEEEELRFASKSREEDNVKSGLWQTLGFFKLLGQLIEVFIPKIFELLIVSMGANPENAGKNTFNQEDPTYSKPPSQGSGDDDPREVKPHEPDNGDQPRGPVGG